jgi:single-strand DNA-binding protein
MARDLNKAMPSGRLVADPEVRATASGQTVGNFRVATGRQWNDAQGQPQSQPEFTPVVAWGRLADLANQYLRKGRQVYVEGRLQTRSWTDKANQKHWRTELVAETIIFLGSPAGTSGSAVPAAAEVGDAPPPSSPESGEPNELKVPAKVTAGSAKPAEKVEEIRIEDIPF